MTDREVTFEGTIRVTDEDLRDAGGDLLQAVQNLTGAAGVQVREVADA